VRDALALAADSDCLVLLGELAEDLSEAAEIAGRRAKAIGAQTQALTLYERKRNVAAAANARQRLASLERAPG
jgi:hypothetical protein